MIAFSSVLLGFVHLQIYESQNEDENLDILAPSYSKLLWYDANLRFEF